MALAKGTRGTGEPAFPRRKRKRRPPVVPTLSAPPRSRGADSAEAAAFVRSRSYKRRWKRQERKRAQRELARAIVSLRERQQEARSRARTGSRDYGDLYKARIDPTPAQLRAAGNVGLRTANRAVSQIAESIIYAPAGVYELGKATGLDVRDLARDRDPSFRRSRKLGKAIGEQVAEDVRHPIRNLGYLTLDIAAAGSVGAGGAARVGAAGRAARAAKGKRRVSQALARKPSEGGSLLRRPAPGREEIAPGVYVNLSRNPAVAAAQRARIKRQKRRPEGSMRGVAGLNRPRNLPERVGFERRRRERIVADIERAPAEGLRARARRLDRAEQTAIRVIGEGVPLERRIARHEQDLAKTKSRTARHRLQRKRNLLIEVHRRGLVKNVDGKPRPGNRKIAEAYELTRASGARREGTLGRLAEMELPGGLTREQAEARRAAPGRVIEGAEFTRTPAQTARREQVREYEVGERQVERPRTPEEAGERLAQLDEAYETTVRGIEEQLTGGMPADPADVARRNLANARLRGKRRGQPRTPTVKQDVRRLAEERLAALLDSRPDDPTVARFAAMLEERNRLRETLTDPERVFGGAEAPAGELGQVRYTEPERTIRRRFPEREARPASAQLEGFPDVAPGELYVPYASRRRLPISRAQAGTARGLGIPRGNVLHGQFTGAALRGGRFPDKAVRAVADAELEAQRYRSVLRIRDQAVRDSIDAEAYVALPERQRRHYIPVRVDRKPYRADTGEFLDLMQRKLDEGQPLTRKERKALERRADKARERIFPDLEDAEALAAAAKGQVRFVDKRTLGGLNEPRGLYGAAGKAATVADEINAASQIAILHLKPAYLTPNAVGQSFLALAQQGALAPWNLAQAARLFKALKPEERAKVRAAAGLGMAKALPVERSRIFRGARDRLAGGWEKVLDSPFRWPAFVHEARLLGYDSPAKIRRLLGDESKLDDLVEAAQRTRDAMIDYAQMAPWEEKFARRVVFFYSWLRGSATYTGRFVRDHPVQAAALMQLAREGQEKAERELGDVPW